jgi:hypothetical protein
MSLLIYSGLLYLLGISIILTFKPDIMFTKDGKWKEFGLGRSKSHYTWIPFWLFAILWAIVSYVIVLVIASHTGIGGVTANTEVKVMKDVIEPENVSMKAMSPPVSANITKKKPTSMSDMKKGYYILDTNETMKKGIPKYIYLGPEAPNLVYHHLDADSAESMESE